jgi:hypothetical protein
MTKGKKQGRRKMRARETLKRMKGKPAQPGENQGTRGPVILTITIGN